MNHSISGDTPLFHLTVNQYLALQNENSKKPLPATVEESSRRYVYRLAGLAELLGCSHPTAHKIKNSGKIPFTQVGRKLIFDADAVLAALNRPVTLKPHRYAKSGI